MLAEVASVAWMARSACGPEHAELFYPSSDAPNIVRRAQKKARVVCEGCPVRSECLDYAIVHGMIGGVWGGLSERERRGLA